MYKLYVNGDFIKYYHLDDFLRPPVKGDYVFLTLTYGDDYVIDDEEMLKRYNKKEVLITRIVHDTKTNVICLYCVSNERGY